MAKKKRVPLNRLVTADTFRMVKALAVRLECSEGEVVDKAVVLLEEVAAGIEAPEPEVTDLGVEEEVVDRRAEGLRKIREVGNEPGA